MNISENKKQKFNFAISSHTSVCAKNSQCYYSLTSLQVYAPFKNSYVNYIYIESKFTWQS